ncbi:MAG: YbjN domain-containing protein [Pseudomonadota bacterium]
MRVFPLIAILPLTACDLTAGGWAPPETPVPTPAGLIDASDPQALTDIVARRGTGFWRRDGLRDPVIRAETAGQSWRVEFYGCSNGSNCTDLRFVAEFPSSEDELIEPDRIADWNTNQRFGKASIDEEGAAVLEMNLILAGGVTRQNFDLTLDWWLLALNQFQAEFAD